jgi:DNA-binding transcriptional MerR regulator
LDCNNSVVAELDINELCEKANVTPRTVHFYVQQGLLPPAGSPGPGARYGEGHVSRIRLIRLLQKQHLPLAEIAKRTKGLTDEQVDGLIAEARERRTQEPGSALDYIRGVLGEPKAPYGRGRDSLLAAKARLSRQAEMRSPSSAPESVAPTRSQWERFTLADGIELHVRRPLSRVEQRQLEKLMMAARTIFNDIEGEEQ